MVQPQGPGRKACGVGQPAHGLQLRKGDALEAKVAPISVECGPVFGRLERMSQKNILQAVVVEVGDGSRVAFRMSGGLYTVKPDGTDLTYVRAFDRECTFLTDRIILYRKAGDVEILDLVTGTTQKLGVLATLPSSQKVEAPTATPDLDAGTGGYQGWIAYTNINWESQDPWLEGVEERRARPRDREEEEDHVDDYDLGAEFDRHTSVTVL